MANPTDHPLEGLRILVVEDEHIIALEIESLLERLHCEVIGPTPRLKRAINLAEDEDIDGALLDVNLRGEWVFPLAMRLRSLEIPFIFSTGYDNRDIPEEFHNVPRLHKPFSLEQLALALSDYVVEDGRLTD